MATSRTSFPAFMAFAAAPEPRPPQPIKSDFHDIAAGSVCRSLDRQRGHSRTGGKRRGMFEEIASRVLWCCGRFWLHCSGLLR